jgi:Cd(II)/Pb(II)-responsive transcriptional regulator
MCRDFLSIVVIRKGKMMRISELANVTGVEIETIRYYEKQGLMAEPGRSANGYRSYASEHLERLSFIRHCRALDMPLAEVRTLLAFIDHPVADCVEVNQLIDEQLARVRARLKSMRALEKQLGQLRKQCSHTDAGQACGILQELVAAAHGEACACHSLTQIQ